MSKLSILLFVLCSFTLLGVRAETTRPLFAKGAETFLVKDVKGQVPHFKLFNDTPSDRALALTVTTTLNMQSNVRPKVPVQDFLDVTIESISLAPATKKDQLDITVKISGHEIDLPKTVDRAKFLAGDSILMDFPETEKQLAVYDLTSKGKLRFHLVPARNEIEIDEAHGHLTYESPFLGSGDQSLSFTGKATRSL